MIKTKYISFPCFEENENKIAGSLCGIRRRQLKDTTLQCFEEIQKEPGGSF